jgi:hypothetical protein
MEQYLKDLKPNRDGIYTLPKDKYRELLVKYSEMKNKIQEYAIYKQDHQFAIDEYKKISVSILELNRDKNMKIMLLNKQINEMSESMAIMKQEYADLKRIADKTMELLKAERAKGK